MTCEQDVHGFQSYLEKDPPRRMKPTPAVNIEPPTFPRSCSRRQEGLGRLEVRVQPHQLSRVSRSGWQFDQRGGSHGISSAGRASGSARAGSAWPDSPPVESLLRVRRQTSPTIELCVRDFPYVSWNPSHSTANSTHTHSSPSPVHRASSILGKDTR